MPKCYKLFFSVVILIFSIGFNFSPAHSQSSNTSGTLAVWGPEVISAVENKDQIDVAAGFRHSLAVRSDGTVVAWGNNYRGQSTVPIYLDDAVAVAAGGYHSLAVRTDGSVVAWGRNNYGQTTVPNDLDDVVAVAAGEYHSLAVRSDGRVFAWGSNRNGLSTVPPTFDDVVAVAAGSDHSLALRSDGTIVAWGSDSRGQSTVPADLDDVVAIAAGGSHSLALRSDGTIVAWGSDYRGQSTVPAGLDDVVAIAAGGSHSLAVRSDGSVVAWGYDLYGQSTVPPGLDKLVAVVAAGEYHSLAIRSDGSVVAWGAGDYWQSTVPAGVDDMVSVDAGNNHTIAARSDGTVAAWGLDLHGQITIPADLDDAVAVAAGRSHSLALSSNGTVDAWGYNLYGQSTVPPGLDDVVAIAAGKYHNLSLFSDGRVFAWGLDSDGQSTVPPDLDNVVAIAAEGGHNLALRSDGTVVAWGSDSRGQSTVPADLDDAVAIAAGGSHSLALRSDGTIVAWGSDSRGQSTVPAGLDDAVAIAAGGSHSLAVRSDGSVVAWGRDDDGQATIPPGLNTAYAVSAGGNRSFALVRVGKDPEPPAPITAQKINFWVHSPDYAFDSIEWVFPDNSEIIPLNGFDGFWGVEESQLADSCDQNDFSDQRLLIKKNEQRVGILHVNLCDQIESNSTFNAVLLLNNEMDIENTDKWDYYSSTDEVMVSMLVAPDGFELDQAIAAGVEPILAVHGVGGSYPYWGNNTYWGHNVVNEINGEDNYHGWQFYYPYDQAIEKSGNLLGEALEYVLGNQLFGQSLSYHTSDIKVLAHSMGGLVTRSHIQSNRYNDTIHKLVMLGTPNHGSYGAYRHIYQVTGSLGGWWLGKDRYAPAYKQMIPGSSFLMNLNQSTPVKLSNNSDYSYITVAGVGARDFESSIHREIVNLDDEIVAVPSVSLLKFKIPLLITDYFHSGTDEPENYDGFTNARGLVLPLLTGEYVSLLRHSKYLGNFGFNDISDYIDNSVPSDLGSAVLDINFTLKDYVSVVPFSVYRNSNEIRIFSYVNNPLSAIGADKIKGDMSNSSSGSFIINSKPYLDDIGLNFEENSQVVEVGRFTGNPIRPWIKIGDPAELEFESLQTRYSGKIELTSAQKLMMKIPVSGLPLKQSERSNIVQYIDAKVDTALIYVELSGESIDVPDYQIALTSPSGVEHSVNNTPANWEVTEDKEQGYAYFHIPDPESGNWEVDYNPSIDNVYVASSITSDVEIISRVQGDNHRVDEPVIIEIEIEGGDQLNSYEIDTEYICYNDSSEEVEAGNLELQNVEVGVYEAQLLATSGSVNCTIEPKLTALVANEEITRTAVSSIDIKANNPTSIDRDGEPDEIPNQSKLHQNYPNPFNPTTNIRFELPESSVVKLEVYNILGQQVALLVDERKSPGRYEVKFDASGLSSGVYLYRLQTDSFIETKQMMLIK